MPGGICDPIGTPLESEFDMVCIAPTHFWVPPLLLTGTLGLRQGDLGSGRDPTGHGVRYGTYRSNPTSGLGYFAWFLGPSPGGASWRLLGRSWVPLGRFGGGLWGLLGVPWEALCGPWEVFGAPARPFGGFFKDSN